MQKTFFSILFAAIIISSCAEKKLSEGFNVSETDKKNLEAAENKMFDQITQFGDYWKTDIADDYITINADGVMQTKAEAMADTAGLKKFDGVSYKLFDRKMRVYGNVGIINGRAQFFVQQMMLAEVFYTELWLKKNDRWLFNGWHGTLTKNSQTAATQLPAATK